MYLLSVRDAEKAPSVLEVLWGERLNGTKPAANRVDPNAGKVGKPIQQQRGREAR